jgi:arylsulfatase A-like enzyme
MSSSRPNLLLIHSDQHRADCLGAAGHPLLRTPHLDCLAREGVRFTHAFTPSPVCTPARNSLFYGCWPSSHLAVANADTEAPRPAREGLRTWSESLRDAGYRLGYVGKWGVSAHKSPLDVGFAEYVPEKAYDGWRAAQGLPPVPRTNGFFGETDPYAAPDQSRPAWGADEAIRMLEEAAQRGESFAVCWSPSEPHHPCTPPEPYASLYSPSDIAPWPNFPDALDGKPHVQRRMRQTWGMDGWTWDDWSPLVACYYGTLALLDAQIGRVLDALDRLGLAENTLVVYTCDHGDLLGAHGLFDKHYCFYEEIARVPLLVRWPGRVARPGSVVDAFVCNEIDLAATICKAAGVPVPDGFQGRSLTALLEGIAQDDRDAAFGQYMGAHLGLYSIRMVRERRWKYVWNGVAEDELYDLESDAGELHNRADDPACAGEVRRLRARLVARMEQTGDPLLNRWTRALLLGEQPVF